MVDQPKIAGPAETPDELAGSEAPLLDHLIELRSRLIKCAIAIAIGSALGWLAYNPVLSWLREPLETISKDPNVKAIYLGEDA